MVRFLWLLLWMPFLTYAGPSEDLCTTVKGLIGLFSLCVLFDVTQVILHRMGLWVQPSKISLGLMMPVAAPTLTKSFLVRSIRCETKECQRKLSQRLVYT